MIKINKGKEPAEWTKYRLTPGVDYDSIPELRESLLKEQGYICAYCMRRIPVKDVNSSETSRIDHIKSREKHPDLKLNYNNMVICCPGAISNEFHCDKSKGEEDITFDLFSDHFIDTISYSMDGEIKSSNVAWNKEFGERTDKGFEKGVLNLNNGILRQNRKEVIKAFVEQLNSMNKNKQSWTKSRLQNALKEWESMHKDDDGESKYKSYCGVIVYYLKKKLRQYR